METNLPFQQRVSVVIPFYNSSATIKRALDSVLSQSVKAQEIIVVDDASSSEELDQLQQIAQSSELIRVIRLKENLGPASARNYGWNASSGNLVAFLDSDDAWHPMKLKTQLEILSKAPNANLVCSATRVVLDGSEVPSEISMSTDTGYRIISDRQLLIRNSIATSTVLLKRELPVRFTEGRKFSEDYELWLRISKLPGVIAYANDAMVFYFKKIYGDSGLSSNLSKMAKGELSTFFNLAKESIINPTEWIVASSVSVLKSSIRIGKANVLRRRPLNVPRSIAP